MIFSDNVFLWIAWRFENRVHNTRGAGKNYRPLWCYVFCCVSPSIICSAHLEALASPKQRSLQQWAFSCFGSRCAGPKKFTFHRRSIPPCRSSPTPGAATWRIPSGAPLKKRIAMYFCNALFGLMLFGFQNHFPLSGKMILLTKKKITIDTPPFRTVVPML